MDIVFATKDLADLYEDNASAKIQMDYNFERVSRFITVINMIRASTCLDDLRIRRCLKYETLTHDQGGLSTVHIDDSHCLIIEDGSYKATRKLIVRALVHIRRRLTESLNIHRRTQRS